MNNSASSGVAEQSLASAVEDQESPARSNIHQTQGDANRLHQASIRNSGKVKSQSSKQVCRYFATKKGCRAGNECRYQHIEPAEASLTAEPHDTQADAHVGPNIAPSLESRATATTVRTPVTKPVSQAEVDNPREFQINQVVRRFKPFRADLGNTTTLKFRLAPTDPDFPFELDTGLHCVLNVPSSYPKDGRPILSVHNPEMAKGFQINIEKGFDELVTRHQGKSLLGLLNDLDRNLEGFLTQTKAATIKFVANKPKDVKSAPESAPPPMEAPSFVPMVIRYSDTQLLEAKTRRDAEIRQLEARLGRSELFSKVGDGNAFNVPLQIQLTDNIPAGLRAVRDTALIVPDVYPLEPCTIILKGVDGKDAENVEVAFANRVVEKPELTLMAHINYLTQNIGKLAIDLNPQPVASTYVGNSEDGDVGTSLDLTQQTHISENYDASRPHLRFMPRPPEWEVDKGSDESDDSETSDSGDEDASEDDLESTAGGASLPTNTGASVERGIQLSFPALQLSGIELLHISRLSIAIKCDRCKERTDVTDLIPNESTSTSQSTRAETCHKCSASLSISFRSDLMHINSSKAGYIDVENCTIIDLLPSTFQPTCSECSTAFPSPPGVIAVRSDTKLTICRSCHAKMTFTIPEVKFLRVSTLPSATPLPLRASKKPKEKLGISAGTPLPNTGKCQHYSKSYRWFRFSCCNRVFPCDKCHDSPATNPAQKNNPHPNEHADRMICGWCSREQRYHPEMCRMCGRSVVRKVVTSGFWEGGKGTRDKNLMSRKEGRKYKVSGREKKEVEEKNRKRKEAKGKGGMWWPG